MCKEKSRKEDAQGRNLRNAVRAKARWRTYIYTSVDLSIKWTDGYVDGTPRNNWLLGGRIVTDRKVTGSSNKIW